MASNPLERLLRLLANVRSCGAGHVARCPAHEDRENSLSIGVGEKGRILLKCFAGCSAESIVHAMGLDLRDLFANSAPPPGATEPLCVADLATDKMIPVDVLLKLGLVDRHDGVLITYRLQDGAVAPRQRLRTALRAKDGSLWTFGKGKPIPYGLDRLATAQEAGYLVLVEGESDCWTLWHHGFPALGIPGADMTGKLEAAHLEGIPKLYVLREPDGGGTTFGTGIASRLRAIGWYGDALVVSCGEYKDPNDLHRADTAGFPSAFQRILDQASSLPEISASPGPDYDPSQVLHSTGILDLTNPSDLASVEAALRRLAGQLGGDDPLRRATVRNSAVDHLAKIGVRSPARMVDAALGLAVGTESDTAPGQSLLLLDPQPWPDPVDGARLLDDISATVLRFVVVAEESAWAIALWVMFAYTIAASTIAPILALVSPVKRCGKTTALDVVGAMIPRRLLASNITAAALYRTIEKHSPTLLIDEADTFLAHHEELRGILNAGHTKTTAVVIRTAGEDFEPRIFSTWCPKAIAMIGKLPSTLEDRSIPIALRRRSPGERVERLRRDRIERELDPIRRQAARWAVDNLEELRESDPDVPAELNDRAQDNWRPLLAIADHAGGAWPERARRAARVLNGDVDESDVSTAIQLLADLRTIFLDTDEPQLASENIVEILVRMEDRPWAECSKGKPLSKTYLARLLKPFKVRPTTIRIGGNTPKGYRLEDLRDAFSRYLPTATATPATSAESQPNSLLSHPQQPPSVADAPTGEKWRHDANVAAVADAMRGIPEEEAHQEEDATPDPAGEEFDL